MRKPGQQHAVTRASASLLRAAVIATVVAVLAGPAGWPAGLSHASAVTPRPSGAGSLGAAQDLVGKRAAALAKASAKAASLAATAAALQTKAEMLTEDYDHQVALAGQAATGYRAAAARLAAAQRTERGAGHRLARQAAEDYEADGGPSMGDVMLSGLADPHAYLGALSVQQMIAGQRSDLLAASQADALVTGLFAQQAKTLLARQRAAAKLAGNLKYAVAAAVSHQAAVVRQAQAARARLTAALASARGRVARLSAPPKAGQRQAARGQDALAALPASVLAGGPAGTAPGMAAPQWSLAAGASAAQGAVAVKWALSQVGRPYQWGGAGPAAYDCSGLAMDAWARADVRLDHWTGFQWVSGPHVPLNQLRPGDLVFYATNVASPVTIHHVGVYIGHGRMVDAPYTGALVRVEGIGAYPGLIGATRPAA